MTKNDWTVREARLYLLDHRDNGVECPCCKQFVKVYRRKVYATMAKTLITFYHRAGGNWAHVSNSTQTGKRSGTTDGTFAKLRYWDLVEEESTVRPDGGRPGWWRVTPKGVQYIHDQLAIPKYALIYNGKCEGFDGESVLISDAFKTPFDYRDLMGGR